LGGDSYLPGRAMALPTRELNSQAQLARPQPLVVAIDERKPQGVGAEGTGATLGAMVGGEGALALAPSGVFFGAAAVAALGVADGASEVGSGLTGVAVLESEGFAPVAPLLPDVLSLPLESETVALLSVD
jgi:hypothetical protein